MKWQSKSDLDVLREIGRRLRNRRLDQNWTQQQLAERAGLNRTTVGDLERGAPASLTTLIQVLRALDGLDELDALLADQGPSPLMLAEFGGHQRQRASGRRRPGTEST